MIIDHLGIQVSDYEKSKEFYSICLAPLDIEFLLEAAGWAGFGKDEKPEFWISATEKPTTPLHVAFSAETRQQVKDFYTAALQVGGKDNGSPGVREIYHANYFGAFIIDPNGHNIEAVCHRPG